MLDKAIMFDAFCLDLSNECLVKGARAIKLRPKAFRVLHFLIQRPGQLVKKEELLTDVWPETFVGEGVLKVAIRQIRRALGDDTKSPRYIETAHRRGYRFIGQITQLPALTVEPPEITKLASSASSDDYSERVVGRDDALSRMQSWFDKMLCGERQIVFVTGEAGIGKTALVDSFARTIASDRNVRISRGQCLEQFGTAEAYLPVLEAIGRLCRNQKQVMDVLRAHAPMWLLQLPALINHADRELLSRAISGATRDRMLREMGDALEVVTADQPLVLIFEDLHWSDPSTVDLISYLATQRQPAKLMVIGTYRTVDVLVSRHPLRSVKRELLGKQQCEELALEYLDVEAIAKYLLHRFPHSAFPNQLAAMIHDKTEGNPLFMVNAVDYLLAQGLVRRGADRWEFCVDCENVDIGVPESIKQMIGKQIDRLKPYEQRMLEAASVVGAEFSTPALIAALGEDRVDTEVCDELVRQHQFINHCGVELDHGQPVSRYGFIHALYRSVLYERLSPSRRMQIHQRVGEQLETAHGEYAREIAAELAMHFEHSHDYARATRYLDQAAQNAIHRYAYHEAVGLSRRGLELLDQLPDSRERMMQERSMQLTLGVPLIATIGYAAPEVGSVYRRASQLCKRLGDTQDVSEVLWGLWTFHTLRSELETAREIAEEFLGLVARLPDAGIAMRAHWAMEITFTHVGEFSLALDHFHKALSFYDAEQHRDDAFLYAQNPGVAMPCFAAWSLWFLGRPDQAVQRIQEALTLARNLSEPHGLAHALFFAATLHQLRREQWVAQEHAESAMTIAKEHGLVLYYALARIVRGWSLLGPGRDEEAIHEMREGIAGCEATGTQLLRPHFLALLAEGLNKAHQTSAGLQVVEEAQTIAARSGERSYEAELCRLEGELVQKLLAGRGAAVTAAAGTTQVYIESLAVVKAEGCFRDAIRIARRQQANSLELRSAMSLARLYLEQSRKNEARDLLIDVYGRFTEGFDTVDMREAQALLGEVS